MADSAFWRELAAQFLLVPDYRGELRADGHYALGSGTRWIWQLAGGAGDFIRNSFESLARNGARELAAASAGTPDLLVFWLEALRLDGSGFRYTESAIEVRPDDSKGPEYHRGTINSVIQASATLCKKLEAESIQIEFETDQRNNPKNWSDLHQMIEASEEFKKLGNIPAKELSEESVRKSLAQIYGIKPEEVTPQQINFEIARLAPFYHSIKLIPSAPTQEAPPIPDTKPSDQAEPKPVPAAPPEETIAAQLQRLRKECNWSADRLAEAAKFDPRTVTRHLSGETMPHLRNISAYERVFSKQLKRQVVINKMP
jgi:hypothetical protein